MNRTCFFGAIQGYTRLYNVASNMFSIFHPLYGRKFHRDGYFHVKVTTQAIVVGSRASNVLCIECFEGGDKVLIGLIRISRRISDYIYEHTFVASFLARLPDDVKILVR